MKLKQRLAAIGSAVALVAGLSLASAVSASATTTFLCAPDILGGQDYGCAHGEGSGNEVIMTTTGNTTNWGFPSSKNTFGEIKQADTNLCMQYYSASGDVKLATCNANSAQEWSYQGSGYTDTWEVQWEDTVKTGWCLYANGGLEVHACSSNQAEEFNGP